MTRLLPLLFGITLATPGFAQNSATRILGLKLETLDGPVPSRYSTGHLDMAERVGRVLGESASYFESTFAIRIPFSVALLDALDWARVTPIPYGLPFVSGPPTLVALPATSDHPLARIVTEVLAEEPLEDSGGLADGELTDLFMTLIGFHELGHVCADETGIRAPFKWISEFAATLIAYDYLETHFPEGSRIWKEVAVRLQQSIHPAKRSLEDFETLYFRVGVENYAWYQVVFLEQAAAVHASGGLAILEPLRKGEGAGNAGDFGVGNLDSFHPGFKAWAALHGLTKAD